MGRENRARGRGGTRLGAAAGVEQDDGQMRRRPPRRLLASGSTMRRGRAMWAMWCRGGSLVRTRPCTQGRTRADEDANRVVGSEAAAPGPPRLAVTHPPHQRERDCTAEYPCGVEQRTARFASANRRAWAPAVPPRWEFVCDVHGLASPTSLPTNFSATSNTRPLPPPRHAAFSLAKPFVTQVRDSLFFAYPPASPASYPPPHIPDDAPVQMGRPI